MQFKRSTKILGWTFAFFALSVMMFVAMLKYGVGNNAGSKFYGDKALKLASRRTGGIGSNSGSEFYGDDYLSEHRQG